MDRSSHRSRRTGALLALAALIVLGGAQAFAGDIPEPPGENLKRIYGPWAPLAKAVADAVLQLGIVLLIALPFQFLFPAVRRRAKLYSYEFWLDLIYWFQGAWLQLVSFYVALQWLVSTVYGEAAPWIPALAELPFWAQVLLSIWAFDFLVYWRHRWEHRLPMLWSFHAVHHTAERIDVLTTTRLHPLELALGALFNAAVIQAGVPPAAAALGFSFYLYYNFFIHANVRIRFPGPLKYVLVSPFMHHWHHANDAEAMGKNVGVVFAWNDWLFGTAYHPQHWPTSSGLAAPPGETTPQSYLRHLAYPVQFFIARVRGWLAARASRGASST
jgi:sterol desaturase/sphingolipid hydroxylase (fatty acid hydroxylase superfamily)